MKNKVRFLIIGAGPTGLGAGLRLKDLDQSDFLILESENQVGGLAASFKDEKGFTWDIGGHVQFSHYKYFDELMEKALGKEGWNRLERESWVWIRDRFVPYPFQNNIRFLPKEDFWKCLEGLVTLYKNPVTRPPENFKDWIHATFGAGLAEVFMEPYNFKVWAHRPEKMSFEWVGERVAVTDLARVIKNHVFDLQDLSWGPNNTFGFPKNGGTGAIWNAVAQMVGSEKILLGRSVKRVNVHEKTVECSDGSKIQYETLLNTIPLNRFVSMLDSISKEASAAASKLVFSASNIVGIGLNGKPPEHLKTKCWMYFPESNSPFYRVTVFSNYSKNNVPNPESQWSLMCEVSESAEKPVDAKTLLKEVEQGLKNTVLKGVPHEVVSRWSYRAEHGYPTPFLGRNEILKTIHAALEPSGIYSRGRFGGWKYEVSNQDHSLMQGVEWVHRILLGIPETTYFFPNTANSNWGK